MKIKNPWFVATVILALLCLALLIYGEINKKTIVSVNGFEMNKEDLDTFIGIAKMNNWSSFIITNAETGEDITFYKQSSG